MKDHIFTYVSSDVTHPDRKWVAIIQSSEGRWYIGAYGSSRSEASDRAHKFLTEEKERLSIGPNDSIRHCRPLKGTGTGAHFAVRRWMRHPDGRRARVPLGKITEYIGQGFELGR